MTASRVSFSSPQASLARRNVTAVVIAALPGVIALLAMWRSATEPWAQRWMPYLSIAICGSWLAAPLLWSTYSFARAVTGSLMVDQTGIAIAGELVARRDDIESAVRTTRGWRGTPVVHLRLRGERFACDLRVASAHDADAVIAALGMDAAHAAVSYVLPSKLFRAGLPVIVSVAAIPIALGSVLIAAVVSHGGDVTPLAALAGAGFAAVVLAAIMSMWQRGRLYITIAPTGLTVRKRDEERVIAWRDVTELAMWRGAMTQMGRARPAGFDLVLSTGERIPMCTAHIAMKAGVYDRDLVVERITLFIPGR
jgi:hypothetical protein